MSIFCTLTESDYKTDTFFIELVIKDHLTAFQVIPVLMRLHGFKYHASFPKTHNFDLIFKIQAIKKDSNLIALSDAIMQMPGVSHFMIYKMDNGWMATKQGSPISP
jgi:hypothetical protein